MLYSHNLIVITIVFLVGNDDEFPVVMGFGSFLMDMFSIGSDLDMSVNFDNCAVEVSRAKRIETLRKFEKKFKALQSNFPSIDMSTYSFISNLRNL